jgi:choline dehydrogenase-like flavoprotein
MAESVTLNLVTRPGSPTPVPVVDASASEVVETDIVVIGSGMGGSTIAHALRSSGLRVLVVEQGDFLPRELENWEPEEVFAKGRYRNAERWLDARGSEFDPGVYYYVGGNTKLYGAMLPRFRAEDFDEIRHHDGVSPAWPLSYEAMEPYYAQAEVLYGVHGAKGADPTDPWRSSDYPFPPLPHEPAIERLATRLAQQGLRPFSMPAAIDLRPGGRCVRCSTCDGFPCMVDAKFDADLSALRPAVSSGTVQLLTRTRVERLHTSPDGRAVVEASAIRDGKPLRIVAQRFIVAGGAVNTAALLLRSGSANHSEGLGNSSGLVGRNYMVHNSTFMVAVDPRRKNRTRFQKTLAWNDWYTASHETPYPLGNVQMLGKLRPEMIAAARRWVPRAVLRSFTDHSIDLYLTSEDLPAASNRVTIGTRGQIVVHWTPNNLASHRELVRRTTRVIRKAGYPLVFNQRMGIATNSHMCGTASMGDDPRTSVVRPDGRLHDVNNVWVADSSLFPSSAAVNPALTIAANALRIADVSEVGQ